MESGKFRGGVADSIPDARLFVVLEMPIESFKSLFAFRFEGEGDEKKA
jgi:hypothetical protein